VQREQGPAAFNRRPKEVTMSSQTLTTHPEDALDTTPRDRFLELVHQLGPTFAERAADHDRDGSFAAEDFAELKRRGFLAAAIPTEFGGGGLSHAELAELLRTLARYAPSTALTLSMHQHLVAATVWKVRRGQPGEALLRRVVDEKLLLVSTGGRDWLDSNGTVERVEGGYRVSAYKAFASGSEAGDVMMSSAPYDDPEEGPQVLHFGLPFAAAGVSLLDDWDAHGMRGTGSRTIVLDNVFVPDAAVGLKRPRGPWHPAWSMAVYLGVAEEAADRARTRARRRPYDQQIAGALGELGNALTTAQLAVESMIALADDYAFAPTLENADAALTRKTIATEALATVADRALEAAGGVGFYRGFGLERLLRDLTAARFHPLPARQQQLLSGRLALGLDPLG
jgi:acyl-CoA dehydrogenase